MSEHDVTAHLLTDSANGPGDLPRLVGAARGAASIPEGSPLAAALASLRRSSDRTMGFVSKPLAYSRQVRYLGKRDHANLIRLIKGGHVRIAEISSKPPAGTIAAQESPHGDRYYELRIGAW